MQVKYQCAACWAGMRKRNVFSTLAGKSALGKLVEKGPLVARFNQCGGFQPATKPAEPAASLQQHARLHKLIVQVLFLFQNLFRVRDQVREFPWSAFNFLI